MKPLRKFKIRYAHGELAKANKIMRDWNIFHANEGAFVKATITTGNTLPTNKYAELLKKTFELNDGELFEIREV